MIDDYKLYTMSPSSWPPWIVHMWKEPIAETNVWTRRSSLVGVPFVCWAVMVWVGEIVEKLAIMKQLENL